MTAPRTAAEITAAMCAYVEGFATDDVPGALRLAAGWSALRAAPSLRVTLTCGAGHRNRPCPVNVADVIAAPLGLVWLTHRIHEQHRRRIKAGEGIPGQPMPLVEIVRPLNLPGDLEVYCPDHGTTTVERQRVVQATDKARPGHPVTIRSTIHHPDNASR